MISYIYLRNISGWLLTPKRRKLTRAECYALKKKIRRRLETGDYTPRLPKPPEDKMVLSHNVYMTQSAKKVLIRKIYGGLPPDWRDNDHILRRAIRHAFMQGIKIRVRYRLELDYVGNPGDTSSYRWVWR